MPKSPEVSQPPAEEEPILTSSQVKSRLAKLNPLVIPKPQALNFNEQKSELDAPPLLCQKIEPKMNNFDEEMMDKVISVWKSMKLVCNEDKSKFSIFDDPIWSIS